MATGSILTNAGRKISLNRTYKATPDYTPVTKFKVGSGTTTPTINDTDIETVIPILDGTVNDDGSNTLTGSNGGDNTTNNTDTYKPGAGLSDNTGQNLIANNGNATKTWAISDLSSAGTNITATSPLALWLYIKDATALAKFITSGTAFEIKVGSDASNYYSKTVTAANLAAGWNWVSTGTTLVNELTETGTVGTPIDYFELVITTNNATDTFVAGDVVYDMLRQWVLGTDDAKAFKTDVTIDEVNLTAKMTCELVTTNANGFNISEIVNINTDGTPLISSRSVFTADSKSDTDEFLITITEKKA